MRAARLAALLLAFALHAACTCGQQMAITFDDLPAHGELPPGVTRLQVAQSILDTLKAQKLPPVYGFINARTVEETPADEEVLTAWRAAGEPLGSHTWSHPNLNDLTAEQFEDEIAKNEPLLAKLMPDADWHWFRYPFLNEGDTLEKRRAVMAWLRQHGYRIAEVNMDFEDYLWNDPYARCTAKGDERAIERLHDTYLATAREYLRVFRAMSQEVYGRDVRYILLLHVGAFDAKMLPELLQMYRAHGVRFVSLKQAEKDSAYKREPDRADKDGGAQLEQMMDLRKLPYPKATKPYKELEGICR